MENIFLLNTLFNEYVTTINDRCMHKDDWEAIERVQKLITNDLLYERKKNDMKEA